MAVVPDAALEDPASIDSSNKHHGSECSDAFRNVLITKICDLRVAPKFLG
jgi:hypothetical protein